MREDTQSPIEVPVETLSAYCRANGIEELSQFGSALREDFGPGSDLDLLVTFRPDVAIGFLALARIQRELAELLGRSVDLVPKSGLKAAIRHQVLASSRLLYAA